MENVKEGKHGSDMTSKRSGVGAPKFNAFVGFFSTAPSFPILTYTLPLISVITDNYNSA